MTMDKRQLIQETQYSFPYHYIPTLGDRAFSQVQYWSWGYRYLGGLRIVIDQLNDLPFKSLIDIGCGDGRLLKELVVLYPEKRFLGVDYSKRAIQLARAMNPDLDYRIFDIIQDPLKELFDVATLVEVLEHIPLNQIDTFISSLATALNENGRLVLTVPHKNSPLLEKHIQHFTGAALEELLTPYFEEIVCIPFDPASKLIRLIQLALGNKGKYYLITNKKVMFWFFQIYQRYFLYAKSEFVCKRIAVVCKKK